MRIHAALEEARTVCFERPAIIFAGCRDGIDEQRDRRAPDDDLSFRAGYERGISGENRGRYRSNHHRKPARQNPHHAPYHAGTGFGAVEGLIVAHSELRLSEIFAFRKLLFAIDTHPECNLEVTVTYGLLRSQWGEGRCV
jgi:hypothetical protein